MPRHFQFEPYLMQRPQRVSVSSRSESESSGADYLVLLRGEDRLLPLGLDPGADCELQGPLGGVVAPASVPS